ncbi:MAG: class III signal peptide-containing protein [archaeon]|nr:class III signal peptide-containing protein [archaeon]
MDKKGQGALEYLLLIGGAVLVAVIVITLLLSIADTGQDETSQSTAAALCRTNAIQANASTPVCAGTTTVNGTTYTCGGTFPNCTAT